MLVIEHDQNYPSFVVSALFQKIGGEEGAAYSREDAYFEFWPIREALVRRGRLFERGANWRIYGIT